jgi:hypothetical protein
MLGTIENNPQVQLELVLHFQLYNRHWAKVRSLDNQMKIVKANYSPQKSSKTSRVSQ